MPFKRIEINFPVSVEITNDEMRAFDDLAGKICDRYRGQHPDRVMWPAGVGFKPTYIPMTAEEEKVRGIEFAEDVFSIDCAERENYDFACTKCGKPQGDHKHCITNPPAGDCEFSATQ